MCAFTIYISLEGGAGMNKIREYRNQSRLTQKELAKLMHTTQQTIGRWENGNPEPSLANLRDLAFVLKTTVGALLGNPWASKQSSRYFLHLKDKEDGLDGFWGNLGILPTGKTESLWYPITIGTCDLLTASLENCDPFYFETLNNKLVIANPKNIKRFVTLDEAADAFPGDWNIEWHEFGYVSIELYDAFEAYLDERNQLKTENNSLSENLRETIKKIMVDHELDDDDLLKFTSGIRIFYQDGTTESYTLTNFDFIDHIVFTAFSLDGFPKTLPIIDDEFSMYIPTDSIALIELPLLKANEALSRLNSLEDEGIE